jgi:Carboxypeptidase regulatory-like domain/TonB-dependent Receptor Plug Domain
MRLYRFILLCFCTLVVVLTGVTVAQTSSGTISGHLVDQSGGIVTDADVKLINQQTNVIVTTKVRSNGDFIFPDVQPGTFAIVVQARGYKEMRQVDLRLSASQSLSTGTLVLQIGQVTESVMVTAAITPLQTTSSERSGVLDTEQLENLLAIGRDSMALTRVLPGVVQPGSANGYGSSSLGTSGTPTVNGVNSEYNLATIDGVTGNTRGLNTLDTPLNMDAVQQVTLLGSNYQAQYGKTAGGNFNFVTKNGTNQFHGGVYYYFRNEDLNANSYFNKFGNSQPRPRYRFNTIGGTLGGPIYWPGHFNTGRDKLFFFVSVEDSPITQPDGLKNYMVPTQAQINGDFSQTYNQGTATQSASTLIHIRVPGAAASTCATNSATAGTGCFPGNKIPAGTINTQMQALMQIMYDNTIGRNPQYAFNNLAVSNNNYNYQTNYSADKPVNQEVFRIDYAPTGRIHMFGRAQFETVNDNDYSSPANTMTWLMPVNYKTTNPNAVFNITYTFNPTVVNELNLGTAGWSETQLYAQSDLAKVTLGAGGFNLPSLYSGVNPLNLFPATTFGGTNAANYGWDSRFPMADQVRSWTITDNVTKIWGNHTFKFGVDWEQDTYLQVNHNRVGNFNTSVNTSNPNESNFGYANAILGNLNQYSQTTKLVNYDPTTNSFEFYYQDTWKVTPKLVFDLGIRNSWAMAQGLKAGNNFVPSLFNPAKAPALYQFSANGSSAVDPTTGVGGYPKAYAGLFVPNTGDLNNGVLYVSTPGYAQGTTYGNGLLWGPRVGFAYSVTPTTVIRGGFGMYNNVRARSGQEGDLTNNAPTTNAPTQYYSSVNASSSNYYASSGQANLNGPFTVGHALPLHSPQLYTEEASIGVQHQLPWGIVLDVAYVGTFTKHASAYYPINNVPYNSEFLPAHQINPAVIGSGTLPDNFFRPYPGFSGINNQVFNLTANYNALQSRVTRRFSKGIEFGVAYTYGRALDFGSCTTSGCTEAYNFTAAVYQDVRAWNYGPAGYDIRHDLVVNYLWSLPKASRLWDNFATRAVLDNWQISGIASYVSGAPNSISLSLSNSQNVTGGGDGVRVVLTCDPSHNAPKTFSHWFNAACVAPPLAGSVPTAANPNGVAYSTGVGVFATKVNFFLPGDANFDTALFKNFPVKERVKLQLRVETYNTFNHSEFNGVNNTATFANANSQSTTTNPQTQAILGQFSSTLNPRLMQLALRLDF